MPTTDENFDLLRSALKHHKIEDAKRILQNFDVTAREMTLPTTKRGSTCLMLVCEYWSSSEVLKFVFDKIFETGGTALLNSQFSATNMDGMTCLMFACGNTSSSPYMVKLILEKIHEVGGPDLLKSQLTATENRFRWNCLMHACRNVPASSQIVKLIFEKIDEVGGPALLKRQLTATARRGQSCLMLACENSTSPEIVHIVLEKIFSFGRRFLRDSLDTTEPSYLECLLRHGGTHQYDHKILFLMASLCSITGLFEEHYSRLDEDQKKKLKVCCKIESGEWSRASKSADSTFGDVIGELKKSMENEKHY